MNPKDFELYVYNIFLLSLGLCLGYLEICYLKLRCLVSVSIGVCLRCDVLTALSPQLCVNICRAAGYVGGYKFTGVTA